MTDRPPPSDPPASVPADDSDDSDEPLEPATSADGEPAAPGMMARNQARNREEVVAAAVRLFLERGYDAVSAEEIAVAAGLSRRTFFRYFGSKDDVLFHRHVELLAEFRALLFDPKENGDLDHLHRTLHAMFNRDWSDQDRAVNRIIMTLPALRARSDTFNTDYERVISDRLIALGHDEIRAGLLAGAVMGTLRAGRMLGLRIDSGRPADIIDAALRVLAEPWPSAPDPTE
jgi:AcrR family transcriptional regulator